MVSQIVDKVLQAMAGKGIDELKSALYCVLAGYEITEKSTEIQRIDESWEKELHDFLIRKRVEGRSDGTLRQYNLHLRRMLQYINKPVGEITEADLFLYVAKYRQARAVSNVYLDNIRRVCGTFFKWLNDKGYIQKNIAYGLDPIKAEKKVKKPFSEIEMEKIRISCANKRDRAIVEFLYSTGIRVSELTKINQDDIDYIHMEVIVHGKGNKERVAYLTPVSAMHLKMYLENRGDDNDALFVSLKRPYRRLSKEAVENIMRKIGGTSGVEKCHPHRIRRTMATNILSKGMPVEEVREILGHAKLDTTMLYCQINKENVKHNHKKYMSL